METEVRSRKSKHQKPSDTEDESINSTQQVSIRFMDFFFFINLIEFQLPNDLKPIEFEVFRLFHRKNF